MLASRSGLRSTGTTPKSTNLQVVLQAISAKHSEGVLAEIIDRSRYSTAPVNELFPADPSAVRYLGGGSSQTAFSPTPQQEEVIDRIGEGSRLRDSFDGGSRRCSTHFCLAQAGCARCLVRVLDVICGDFFGEGLAQEARPRPSTVRAGFVGSRHAPCRLGG